MKPATTERRVSVVVPTYNRAALLPRALDSVLAQSRPADELIVVDDGSEDGSAALLAARYPQARVLRQPNRGVSAARNAGIRAARGGWIALLDSDDLWRPDKLARQLAAAGADARLVHCDELWIRDGRRVNPKRRHAKYGGYIYRRCLPLCALSPSAVLIRREVFAEIGLFDESLPACEDYDLWLRVCARYPVRYLDEPLVVKYGGHDDQLSRRYWGMDRFRIVALEKILAGAAPLGVDDRRATLQTLLSKLEVYLAGVEKRGRADEAVRYRAKRDRALAALAVL